MSLFFSTNPANDEIIWQGKEATAEDIQKAIVRSEKALKKFSKRTFEERAAICWKFATLLDDKLAETISQEMGKPLWDAKHEVQAMKNKIEISIQAYHERCPVREYQHGKTTSITRHKPHGIVAVFGPFNFPGHLPNGHIVPALLAGNTVLFKPSELTPKTGEAMGKLWEQAGLDEDVLQVIQGGKDVGRMLTAQEAICGIFFTGSVHAGRSILENSFDFPNRIVALELGGNNPLIVTSFDEIDAAIYTTIQSAFLSSGQRCTAARRLILVKNKKTDGFLQALAQKTKELVIGPYTMHPEPYMGPVVSKEAAKKIEIAYEERVADGYDVILPLKRLGEDSAFLTPSLIERTKKNHTIDTEIFGPVLEVIFTNTLEEAILEANNTSFGLSCGLLSTSEKEFQTVYDHVKAGIINWNTPTTGASSRAPFGGVGLSGNFRPAGYYSCDYCAYPVASTESSTCLLPDELPPGFPRFSTIRK